MDMDGEEKGNAIIGNDSSILIKINYLFEKYE